MYTATKSGLETGPAQQAPEVESHGIAYQTQRDLLRPGQQRLAGESPVAPNTREYQIAREKIRQIESRLARGDDNPLPTRTPIGEVVAAYIEHMKAHRAERSWKRDMSYLRESFGECCPALALDSERAKKCRAKRRIDDKRKKLWPLSAPCFEEISTAAISEFIAERVRARGLKPKTENRYRETVAKVFAGAMETERVRMPMDRNPGAKVARYREPAPEIRYLTLEQIDEQLEALQPIPLLRVMVATLIYAGLRREEVLWLQTDDFVPPSEHSPNGLLLVHAKTVEGKGWQPKTRRSRVVPTSRDLRRLLDFWSPPTSDNGWLFPSRRGTRWDVKNFSQALARVTRGGCLDMLGLPAHLREAARPARREPIPDLNTYGK